MTTSIKDLYDYELVIEFCRSKFFCLKSNFHKNKKKSDGLNPQCTSCRKLDCDESLVKIKKII